MTLATLPQTHGNPDQRMRRGNASDKADYQARLSKVDGQICCLQRLVADDCYCPDMVVQIASATRALQDVALGLLNDHLNQCVITAACSSDAEGEQSVNEVATTIRQV